MPRNTDRRKTRDNDIRTMFRLVCKKNPKWKTICVIDEVAAKFYLSPVTVGNILKKEGEQVPVADTIAKHTRQHYA